MDRVRTYGLAGVGGLLVVVAVLVMLNLQNGAPRPPMITSGLLIAGLLLVLAAIAALGVRRRSSALLTAAGLSALVPAWLSVALLPLAVVGALLLFAATRADRPAGRTEWLVAIAIVGLSLASLASLLSLTETRCWVGFSAPDGYSWEFVGESQASGPFGGPGQPVVGGCDEGVPATAAIGLVAVLGISGLAIAARGAAAPPGRPARRRWRDA
jgi:hypothetical protein